MIHLPNNNSIIQKIYDCQKQYIKEYGFNPDVIYLDAEERKDLGMALGLVDLNGRVKVAGMKLKRQEDYNERHKGV